MPDCANSLLFLLRTRGGEKSGSHEPAPAVPTALPNDETPEPCFGDDPSLWVGGGRSRIFPGFAPVQSVIY